MKNWDKILKDFSHKCKGGAPDFTNSDHLNLLRESLLKFGWKENATNEFIGNLREKKKPRRWAVNDKQQVVYRTVDYADTKGWPPPTDDQMAAHKEKSKADKGKKPKSEKEIQDSFPDTDKGKKQKKSRRYFFSDGRSDGRLSDKRLEQLEKDHPDYKEHEDEVKQIKSLFEEFTNPNTTDERKAEISLQLKNDYGMETNSELTKEDGSPKDVKLYIRRLPNGKKVPRWMEKMLCSGKNGSKSSNLTNLVNDLNENLDEENQIGSSDIGGDNESQIKQHFVTDAKPGFGTPKRTKTRPHPDSYYTTKSGKRMRRREDKDNPGMWKDKDGNLHPLYITDPVVDSIMSDPPLSDLEDKEPGNDVMHSLDGPNDDNGNLLAANTPENQRKHLEWMVNENTSNQKVKSRCDHYINILESQDPRDEAEIAKFKGIKAAIEDNETEMKRIMKDHKIPSKEAEEAVKKANGKLMDDLHNAHPAVAEGIAKQVAEVALVQQELAKGEECYLPTAGNFPGGDKVRVTRNGSTVEKVVGISVKFGRGSKNTQIYGFPAEASSVSKYAEVPKIKNADGTEESDADHKERQEEVRTRSGGKVGETGLELAVRDDIVEDKDKQSEIIDSAGMGKAVTDKDEYHKVTNEILMEVKRYKADMEARGMTEKQIEISLQNHLKDFMAGKIDKDGNPLDPPTKPSLNDRFEESIDREELALSLTGRKDGKKKDGSRHSNSNMAKKCNAIEFLSLATVGSVIREGQGMPSLSWNHQSYENGEYMSHTVEPTEKNMTNLACWGFLSRMYRSDSRAKGGGILTTGTGECE
jgi:hypothetical protein